MDNTTLLVCEDLLFDNTLLIISAVCEISWSNTRYLCKLREQHYKVLIEGNPWLDNYNDLMFFRLFRMKKATFHKLFAIVMENDQHKLLTKAYRGGHEPIEPEKAVLVFLWFMGTQDTLISIAETFKIVSAAIHKIVNNILYIIISLKRKFIFWPKTQAEINHVINGFTHYPNVLGAVDGSHIEIKVVPYTQHDSYVNRYMGHSINAMVISNSERILLYAFVGFPGSAHDSRVFSNSTFVRNIEQYGTEIYFPTEDHHIIGDSAFPLRPWLMTPYKRTHVLTQAERHHNFCLSSDRVVVENIFARIKGRFRRLIFINVYSIAKCVEIATAACVLHNYCYLNNDEWNDDLYYDDQQPIYAHEAPNAEDIQQARRKRDRIAQQLLQN